MNPPSHDYFNYLTKLYSASMLVDQRKINEAYDLLLNNMSNVAIMGNGGSAAVADHFCCDFVKGIRYDTNLRPRCTSLVSNGPVLTAIANDYSYNFIFSRQIEYVEPSLVIAVSSSGNSRNIVEGLLTARSLGIKTIALVGFDGGTVLKQELADVVIHINTDNYGIIEDCHMMILHSLVQKIRTEFATDPKNLKL
jgi:phosphoheptose isomerase